MSADASTQNSARWYALALFILTGLFMFRVLAQLIQVWRPVAFLPSFEVWQSGALPYPILLMSQVVILWVCLRVVWQMFLGVVVAAPKNGRLLLSLGGLYLLGMGIRLMIGLTASPEHAWFGALLPTIFHFVLATFMLVYGLYHVSGASPSKRIPLEANV
ncbi:MAG TPA: hypothetical protein PKK23_05565 [Nitrospirales bacterium]|nr:hypothetical protein [Nitrospiraceae bacterium]HNP28490.1 hypothetical protein [Nitrospirales bacterium]